MSGRLRELLGVPAPAKLNWFLHVLGRREDGLHELQTVFQFIDWCDELDFELRADGVISREGGDALPAEDLCVRSARALQAHSGCRLGVHMRLRKHVPAQAGLGGGSSDAATVLLALNHLWGLRLDRAELLRVARTLGADVPVFVFGRGAFADGVGTRLRELDLPRWPVLVAWPGEGLSTAQVFSHEALTRNTPARTMEGFCEHLKRELAGKDGPEAGPMGAQRMRGALEYGANDLQDAAVSLLPRMEALQQWLRERCGGARPRMSGSGSAMFAPWPGEPRQVLRDVPPGWSVRVCSALRQHPLLGWAHDGSSDG